MAIPLDVEDDRKYVVHKLENGQMGELVDDAVVIRLKDPFAATALHSYSNTIISFVELMTKYLSDEEKIRMIDIADYFSSRAYDSEKIRDKRLPD